MQGPEFVFLCRGVYILDQAWTHRADVLVGKGLHAVVREEEALDVRDRQDFVVDRFEAEGAQIEGRRLLRFRNCFMVWG